MALSEKEVAVCNLALDRFGATNFTFANQATDVNGIRCNRHYEQTRKAVSRSYEWNFASARKTLTADTTAPDFEYDCRYKLPTDFLRLRKNGVYSGYTHVVEGGYILSDDSAIEIKYIKDVTDPDEFDPLFTEVLVLTLAKRLIPLIAGTKSAQVAEDILRDLQIAKTKAAAVCATENDDKEDSTWNNSRYGSGKV